MELQIDKSEYFQILLNIDAGREAEFLEISLKEGNVKILFEICVDDVKKAVKRLKSG